MRHFEPAELELLLLGHDIITTSTDDNDSPFEEG